MEKMLVTNTKQAGGGMAPGQLVDAHTCWAGDGAALPSGQAQPSQASNPCAGSETQFLLSIYP